MNPEMMLAQLAPLRTPSAITWWPPAPGWWLIAIVLLIVLTFVLRRLWRRRMRNHYRRIALAELRQMRASGASVDAVNWLLKATALRGFPPAEVAALHGPQWRTFLDKTCKHFPLSDVSELEQLYQALAPVSSDALLSAAEHWIKHHEVSRV